LTWLRDFYKTYTMVSKLISLCVVEQQRYPRDRRRN